MSFAILQCGEEACRFRFPAEAAAVHGLACPRCRGPLAVAAVVTRPAAPPDITPSSGVVALLDNIRSVHNVGSMFRTADGAGLGHLHLAGITATPAHPRLAKAALGSQYTVAWTYHRNSLDAAAQLRAEGYRLWALERVPGSQHLSLYEDGPRPARLALVVGNEQAGVDPGLLEACDAILSLPMGGEKRSLNVAVAFGIAVYHLNFAVTSV